MSYILYRNFWGKWFGKAKSITVSAAGISLVDIDKNSQTITVNQLTDFPFIESTIFGKTLVISTYATDKAKITADLSSVKYSAKDSKQSTKSHVSKIWGLNARSANLFNQQAKLNLYKEISDNIERHADVFHQQAMTQYLRDSVVPALHFSITPCITNYLASKTRWQSILSAKQLSKIDVISRLPDIKSVESYRQSYERKLLSKYADFFDRIEANPLTNEQRLAVIRNNDYNLILAAAGTGKTSVMVAKALHLIIHLKVPADKVLILAYNNAAASELKERLERRKTSYGVRCDSPSILTFHALGLKILNAVNENTKLSSFATDSALLERWFSHWLEDLISQNESSLEGLLNLTTLFKADKFVIELARDYLRAHLSSEQVIEALKSSGLLTKIVKNCFTYLQAIRVEQLDKTQIESRLFHGNGNTNASLDNVNKAKITESADFLNALVQAYSSELNKQGAIDFDDMISNAFTQINNGHFTPPWSDILVDEFQDISSARMHLLSAIINKGPRPKLTVVGDDWQSIYRFSGGKLDLITQFEKYMGSHSLTTLQKTFRYNNSIADTAGQFVMQNPEQYTKQIDAHAKVEQSQVFLIDCENKNLGKASDNGIDKSINARISQIVKRIRDNDPDGKIAILARYRYLLDNAKTELSASHFVDKNQPYQPKQSNQFNHENSNNIHYWTFHSAKGLEADYCIIVGLFSGNSGFPSTNKEDAILEALLPISDGFEHSEERRLFYVALTRAKKKVYLIADPNKPSAFIEELLSPSYDLQLMSDKFNALKKISKKKK
ncbi:UvrD-helicase domain-containing protein [Colwellia echini]|uniref:DNA 3'-5' helicase n=1 Tax=Colwellia echini TaxID=1982103 RepID=A0ABY3N0B3_9GAMM|nr:UvrD-helicase domain-containing protein [Colwellia echini]TYK66918.1 AAA family ATPase [Colwellia echini]